MINNNNLIQIHQTIFDNIIKYNIFRRVVNDIYIIDTYYSSLLSHKLNSFVNKFVIFWWWYIIVISIIYRDILLLHSNRIYFL